LFAAVWRPFLVINAPHPVAKQIDAPDLFDRRRSAVAANPSAVWLLVPEELAQRLLHQVVRLFLVRQAYTVSHLLLGRRKNRNREQYLKSITSTKSRDGGPGTASVVAEKLNRH
jgi:hypothetical protein